MLSISIIAQPIPQSPSLLAHRSVTHVQHILIWFINGEELTYFSFLNTLLRLPDPLRIASIVKKRPYFNNANGFEDTAAFHPQCVTQ
jgi:hypothetical protein